MNESADEGDARTLRVTASVHWLRVPHTPIVPLRASLRQSGVVLANHHDRNSRLRSDDPPEECDSALPSPTVFGGSSWSNGADEQGSVVG